MCAKKNVLVFSGATYPAMQIIDCLKNSPRFHVIAAASYSNHSEFVCDDVITDIPFVYEEGFIGKFNELLVNRQIDYVIPTDETIAVTLKKYEDKLSALIVCSPYETALLCRHKSRMYEALSDKEYVPQIYQKSEIDNIVDYPVFIKPDEGQGSKGSRIITCRKDFDTVEDLEDMVICEYLPGEEYTVDCFTTKDRELIFCNPKIRCSAILHVVSS